jgi:hypothetical protein
MDDTECQLPSAYKKKKKKGERRQRRQKKKKKILDDSDDDLETPFLKIDKCQRQQKEEPLFKTIVLVFNTHTHTHGARQWVLERNTQLGSPPMLLP